MAENDRKSSELRVKISRNVVVLALFSSVLCMALLAAAIYGTKTAFAHINPSDHLSVSADQAYAFGSSSFLVYDLVHIFVIWIFAFLLARTSYTLTWLGVGWLVLSSLADLCSLGLTMFVNTKIVDVISVGNGGAGSAVPFSNYELFFSILELIQSFSGLVGYAFLLWPVFKARGAIRAAGFFVVLGFPLGLLQISELGRSSSSTLWMDLWVTPLTEMIQHGAIAVCFVILLRRWNQTAAQKVDVVSAY